MKENGSLFGKSLKTLIIKKCFYKVFFRYYIQPKQYELPNCIHYYMGRIWEENKKRDKKVKKNGR